MPTSGTLQSTLLVHPSDSRCSQTPMKQPKVRSDAGREFSDYPESNRSCGVPFITQYNLFCGVFNCRSSLDLLQRSVGARETYIHMIVILGVPQAKSSIILVITSMSVCQ